MTRFNIGLVKTDAGVDSEQCVHLHKRCIRSRKTNKQNPNGTYEEEVGNQ